MKEHTIDGITENGINYTRVRRSTHNCTLSVFIAITFSNNMLMN